ncbi:hypothetical protein LSH36_571g00049 [Paralvinella palmiformis]|uniref:G-protein coupled receptors family 1 profile domain-containing protein n=1 Tax=Paralvinella palmiformis TaxID=53620 RepID=A0AAD9MXY3_9ANNE|nr:hypothetical protein LSH36_571g00049 [Paralvinella palmiformis]
MPAMKSPDSKLLSIIEIPPDVAICGLIFGAICIGSSLFGNSLIIATVIRERSLRHRQNVLVISMAAAEIVLIVVHDLFVIGVYGKRKWTFGAPMISATLVINICRNAIAVGHIVAITVYRSAKIVHQRAYRLMSSATFIGAVLVVLYLFPLGTTLLLIRNVSTETYLYNTKGMWPVKESVLYHEMSGRNRTQSSGQNSLFVVFSYLLANVAILAFCYVDIYIFVKRSRRTIGQWAGSRTGPSSGERGLHAPTATALATTALATTALATTSLATTPLATTSLATTSLATTSLATTMMVPGGANSSVMRLYVEEYRGANDTAPSSGTCGVGGNCYKDIEPRRTIAQQTTTTAHHTLAAAGSITAVAEAATAARQTVPSTATHSLVSRQQTTRDGLDTHSQSQSSLRACSTPESPPTTTVTTTQLDTTTTTTTNHPLTAVQRGTTSAKSHSRKYPVCNTQSETQTAICASTTTLTMATETTTTTTTATSVTPATVTTTTTQPIRPRPPEPVSELAQRSRSVNREITFIRTMFIIFVTFTISYFGLPILKQIDGHMTLSHWLYLPFVIINWFSSSTNWIVYGLTQPAFRAGFRKLLGCSSSRKHHR